VSQKFDRILIPLVASSNSFATVEENPVGAQHRCAPSVWRGFHSSSGK
jgi:hypothetical protein